jgi:hypothetical protein
MAEVKDIRLDEKGDIAIIRGDFAIEPSDQTHIEHILISNKGYFFEHPLLGVGIIDELNGSKSKQELKQTIRRQLVFDNFSVKKVSISQSNEIDINAVRKI